MDPQEQEQGGDDEARLGVCFVHPSWFGGPLGPHNVLDFFSASDFYDKSCNNELLRMQERDMSLLRAMTGLEYEIRYADEAQGIFLLCKQIRESPDLAHPQTYYYVMHGTVYQCPTIQHVLTARMTTCSYHLEEAFRMVSAAVRFDPSTEPNYSYDFTAATDAAQPSADEDPDRPEDDAAVPEKTQEELYRLQQTADRSSRILNSIVGQFPLPGEVVRPPPPAAAGGRAQGKRPGDTAGTKKRRLVDL